MFNTSVYLTTSLPGYPAKLVSSATYSYLTLQRTSLGLTKSNLGLAQTVRTVGIINIVLGAGILLLAIGMFARSRETVKA